MAQDTGAATVIVPPCVAPVAADDVDTTTFAPPSSVDKVAAESCDSGLVPLVSEMTNGAEPGIGKVDAAEPIVISLGSSSSVPLLPLDAVSAALPWKSR